MARSLVVQVDLGTGQVGGRALWMDRNTMVLASDEPFAQGQELDARIDLGGTGPAIAAFLVVGAVEHEPVDGAFLHAVRWAVVSRGEERRLLGVLAGIRPDAKLGVPAIPWVDAPAAPRRRQDATPPPVAGPAPPPTRPVERPRVSGPLLVQVIHWPAPGGGSVFVRVSSVDVLRRIVMVERGRVRVALPTIKGLLLDDEVTLTMQLSDGMFIDLVGVVVRVRTGAVVLEARDASEDTRVVLRGLLEAA